MSSKEALKEIFTVLAKGTHFHSHMFTPLDLIDCGWISNKAYVLYEVSMKREWTDAWGNVKNDILVSLFDIISIALLFFVNRPLNLTVSLNVSVSQTLKAGDRLKFYVDCGNAHAKILLFNAEVTLGDTVVAIGTHCIKILENVYSSEKL